MNASNSVVLPALDGRSALGFLAALGVVQLLSGRDENVRLSWSRIDACAALHSAQFSDLDSISAALAGIVAQLPDDVVIPYGPPGLPPPGEAPDKLRLKPAALHALIADLRRSGDPAVVDSWIGSLVTDLAIDNKERCAHTLFGAFSGKQSMFTMLSKTLSMVRERPEYLHEALVGWRRVDGVTGEYLDHRVLFDAADSPSGESRERGVPGATWLALMSYPLIRTTSIGGQRPISTGWYTSGRRLRLRWPLWEQPLTLAALQTLWECPLLTAAARADDMSASESPRNGTPATVIRQREDFRRALLKRGELAHRQLRAMGVFAVQRAERRRIPGRNFAGVLAPVLE